MVNSLLILKTRISLFLLFLFVLTSLNCVAQSSKIDSLKSLLSKRSGVEYSDVLYELVREYGDIDYQLALQYANEAFIVSKLANDSLRIVRTGRVKSQILRRIGEMDSAIYLFNEMLLIARRHNYTDELKAILNALGLAYTFTANYERALSVFQESLELRENSGDKFEIGVGLQNIGLVYYKLADFDRALSFYKRSLQLRSQTNKYGIEQLYVNISLCYIKLHNFSKARSFINEGFAYCASNCPRSFLLEAELSLGMISFEEKNWSLAEKQFLKSYSISKALGEKRFQLDNLVYLLQVYIERNEITLAEEYLKRAEKLIESGIDYNVELLTAYSKFSKLYERSGNYEKVAYYQNKYITLKDTVYNQQFTANMMKIEADYLQKQNRARIESQNKILSLNEQVIRTHKFLNIFVGIVALLFFTLIIVLIKSNRLKQKHNILLDKKVQERTHQLQLNHDSLQRASQERDILLQKISTDINNALVTLKGLCSLGMKDIQDPHALEYISKMNTTSESFSNILTKLHFIRSSGGALK